jgi:restriction system protein
MHDSESDNLRKLDVKFKMAPNSLFAVLLRSPWWISFCIALGLGLVSRAALPDQYWVLGAMGGFPFVVLGSIAFFKQLRALSPQRVDDILRQVSSMSWRDFSAALEKALSEDGVKVARLEGPVDFVVKSGGKTLLVVAKRWKSAQLGEDVLKNLHAAMRAEDASQGLVVSLGELSTNAQAFANSNNIKVQGSDLANLMRHLAT